MQRGTLWFSSDKGRNTIFKLSCYQGAGKLKQRVRREPCAPSVDLVGDQPKAFKDSARGRVQSCSVSSLGVKLQDMTVSPGLTSPRSAARPQRWCCVRVLRVVRALYFQSLSLVTAGFTLCHLTLHTRSSRWLLLLCGWALDSPHWEVSPVRSGLCFMYCCVPIICLRQKTSVSRKNKWTKKSEIYLQVTLFRQLNRRASLSPRL